MKKIYILIFIITAVLMPLWSFGEKKNSKNVQMHSFTIDREFSDIELKWNYGDIVITQHGNECSIKTDSENIKFTVEDNKLLLSGGVKKTENVTVNVPDKNYKEIEINAGVGNVKLQNIKTSELELSLNVGGVDCQFSEMPKETDIEVGTGDVNIKFPGTNKIEIEAPFGLGQRDFGERITVVKKSPIEIDVSVGNICIR